MILLAYALSIGAGYFIGGACIHGMYRSIGHSRRFFKWLDLWVGGTERAVTTTLVIWAPQFVPAFVGGWVVLKVAANWQRREGQDFGERHLVALVGSVISFTIAIGAGLLANPDALYAWASEYSN